VRQAAERDCDAPGYQAIGVERLAAKFDPSRQAGMQIREEGRSLFGRCHGGNLDVRVP
jgi:hypothetical protein